MPLDTYLEGKTKYYSCMYKFANHPIFRAIFLHLHHG